jgi:methylated-DNA-[protein]-cysteine S-methyltransferase
MSNRIFFHRQASPVGPLLLLSDGAALIGLYTSRGGAARAAPPGALEDPGPFRDVSTKLDAYFAGRLTHFDVPLRLDGTAFQRAVWSALMAITHGTTISYRELAARIGNPRAMRAVGAANGRNPVSIIVPCHRVIGAGGELVGYGGGLACKRWLLDHERAQGTADARPTRAQGSSVARAAAVTR